MKEVASVAAVTDYDDSSGEEIPTPETVNLVLTETDSATIKFCSTSIAAAAVPVVCLDPYTLKFQLCLSLYVLFMAPWYGYLVASISLVRKTRRRPNSPAASTNSK